MTITSDNPFKPGAGHKPPYLAGRTAEQNEVKKSLQQKIITQNIILTGLRGVGKTVLLESLKPIAFQEGWLWAGTDLSESASITEETLAIRILTDISRITSALIFETKNIAPIGFVAPTQTIHDPVSYEKLIQYFSQTPGLVADKLKATLEMVWEAIPDKNKTRGIVFAYDEAQNLTDHAKHNQYPLSLLLEVFQSLQRKNISYLLIFTGLPTLFPKLVAARTYAERMFHMIFLKPLTFAATKEAIIKPIQEMPFPIKITAEVINCIATLSGGYPYFIQFICKEVFDVFHGGEITKIPEDDIIRKLDTDFFQGRWARATDRQQYLLRIVAILEKEEFTVQEITALSKKMLTKPFSPSHINQMLLTLAEAGLIYKNRFGKYSFAVPLLGKFILRQSAGEEQNACK